MILDRYLIREITRPFLAMATVLTVIFISYSMARFLSDAAAGLLPTSTVVQMVLIKSLIALEVLLPIALYLGVVVGLGRLYSDHEMIVLTACGVSDIRVLGTILRLALLVAMVVAFLSIVVRPWAYQERFNVRAAAEVDFDLQSLESGVFHVSPNSEYTIFAETMDSKNEVARSVLFKIMREDNLDIIAADELRQGQDDSGDPFALTFSSGNAYVLDRQGTQDVSLSFDELTLRLAHPEARKPGYRSKTQSSLELRRSENADDVAELQWRFSTPIITVLLALLAVPLSQVSPRQGKYGKVTVALLVYALYYNLTTLAKGWVEQGIVGSFPGLWWPHVLLMLLLTALVGGPRVRRAHRGANRTLKNP